MSHCFILFLPQASPRQEIRLFRFSQARNIRMRLYRDSRALAEKRERRQETGFPRGRNEDVKARIPVRGEKGGAANFRMISRGAGDTSYLLYSILRGTPLAIGSTPGISKCSQMSSGCNHSYTAVYGPVYTEKDRCGRFRESPKSPSHSNRF